MHISWRINIYVLKFGQNAVIGLHVKADSAHLRDDYVINITFLDFRGPQNGYFERKLNIDFVNFSIAYARK